MVPQVGGPPAVEGECRHEGRHLPARLPQRPHGSPQRPPRPHGIEQQPDADPFPRPGGERLDEPAPDGVDVEDEKLRVQMVTGGSDQGEDGIVCLVPAAKEGDAVPFRRRRRSRREEDLVDRSPTSVRSSSGRSRLEREEATGPTAAILARMCRRTRWTPIRK